MPHSTIATDFGNAVAFRHMACRAAAAPAARRPARQRRSGCGTDRSRADCGRSAGLPALRSRSPPGAGRMKRAVERMQDAGYLVVLRQQRSIAASSLKSADAVASAASDDSGASPRTIASSTALSGRAPWAASATACRVSMRCSTDRRLADHVQAMRDQGVFELEHGFRKLSDGLSRRSRPRQARPARARARGLRLDQRREIGALRVGIRVAGRASARSRP